MANPNAPFGFRPIRHLFGGVIRPNLYTIADAYSTALFTGDPVRCTGLGRNIGIGTAGSSSAVTGVFAGCRYVNLLGDTIFSAYWPASQATNTQYPVVAEVYDDPFILYEVMMDTLAAADVRLFTDMVAGTGSTVTRQSAWTAAGVAGSENQLKIYGLANCTNPGPVANAYGAYAVAEVLFMKHELVAPGAEI